MGNVFDALDSEWAQLCRTGSTARRLPDVRESAGGARTVADIETYVRAATPPDADKVLLTLVTHVVVPTELGIDPAAIGPNPRREQERTAKLAARVLLQLLLPGTRKLARKWWALGDHHERAAAAVAAVYHHIRTYPLTRRPGRIAANILMDASYDLSRLVPKIITTPVEDPTVLRAPINATTPNPAEELATVLCDAIAQGTITQPDAELIARTRIAAEPIHTLAHQRQRTPRTLWHHRQHAERALALGFNPAI